MKLAGINIGLETVVILGAGIITGRWILPALAHGMASHKISINAVGCPPGRCRALGLGTGPDNPCNGLVTSDGCSFP